MYVKTNDSLLAELASLLFLTGLSCSEGETSVPTGRQPCKTALRVYLAVEKQGFCLQCFTQRMSNFGFFHILDRESSTILCMVMKSMLYEILFLALKDGAPL